MTETRMDEQHTWLDSFTMCVSVVVLIAFTVLSCYLNAVYATRHGEDVSYHVALPILALFAGIFAEVIFMSHVHWTARWVTGVLVSAGFGAVMLASYLAVLGVAEDKYRTFPRGLIIGLAAFPDGFMVIGATVLLALRVRRDRIRREASSGVAEATDAFMSTDPSQSTSPQVDGSVTEAVTRHEARHDASRDGTVTHHETLHEALHDGTVARHETLHDGTGEASVARHEARHDGTGDASVAGHEARHDGTGEASMTRVPARREPLKLHHDPQTLAEMIADQTTITQPVELIVKVLEAALVGGSQRDIAKAASTKKYPVSESTARRIIKAAVELDTTERRAFAVVS